MSALVMQLELTLKHFTNIGAKNWDRLSFINTKKAFKKLYIFILRRFGLFLIHLHSLLVLNC